MKNFIKFDKLKRLSIINNRRKKEQRRGEKMQRFGKENLAIMIGEKSGFFYDVPVQIIRKVYQL